MKIFFKFACIKRLFAPLAKRHLMTRPETLEQYYAARPFLNTADFGQEEGHFNVFQLEESILDDATRISYGRKDYYKICVVSGESLIHYADKSFKINQHALLFANPRIPYNWETAGHQQGHTCIFTETFFAGFGNVTKYPFFLPGGYPVYELDQSEYKALTDIFRQMTIERASDFIYKNDALRNLIFQLCHAAMKIRPSNDIAIEKSNAASRITNLFIQLLESQFPVGNANESLALRSASEFANQMAVHVNHLNKSVKETLHKTTTEIISQRLLKESKILLRHSSWAISEIAYALGFEGPAHFSSFFRKQLQISPSEYRKR